jgi:hypothetical protein
MPVADPETETKLEEVKTEETKTTAEKILENMTPEVRSALEAMRRISRSRKAITQPAKLPQTKYFRLP